MTNTSQGQSKQIASAPDLWNQESTPFSMRQFVRDVADTEKLLLFGETGSGKTYFYLKILEYQSRVNNLQPEDLRMVIIFPDRPTGLTKLRNIIPEEYYDSISIFPVNNYEETIRATATAEKIMEEHYKKTGHYGWIVFELLENYWTFAQDYYSRQAYGKSLGDYFAQMQSIVSSGKGESKPAYEAFAGPYGGPWPIIKFFHNFNWIDRIKRFPYNIVFTSEIKEEDNSNSIFYTLGYRPAGEKHNQHRVDTILYLGHKGAKFTMKPFKLTGYTRLYAQIDITNKNGYEEHKKALRRLDELGYCVSKLSTVEKEAGISPPKPPTKKESSSTKDTEDTDKNEDDVYSIDL